MYDNDNKPGNKTDVCTTALEHILKCTDSSFIDFIKKCLSWDPELRLTASEGLSHPWITQNGYIKVEKIKLSVSKLNNKDLQSHLQTYYSTQRETNEMNEFIGKMLNRTDANSSSKLRRLKDDNKLTLTRFKEKVKAVAASQLMIHNKEKWHNNRTVNNCNEYCTNVFAFKTQSANNN